MKSGEKKIAMIWSGEGLNLELEDSKFKYVIPEEGADYWLDSWAIPKDAQNVSGAEKFINFMSNKDIALRTADEIGYTSPQKQAIEEQPEEEGEKVVRSYELVRCTFHAYEKIDVPENREQLRRDMLAERKRAAFQELGMKLMENAKIEYPQGTAIFEVAKPKKKSHKKPAKAYNKEGGKQNGEATNTVTAVRGAKGSAQ